MSKVELMEKRAQAFEECKKFAAEHAGEDGLLSAEDSKTYEEMEKKIENYTQAIARAEREEKMENELKQPTSAPIVSNPSVDEKDAKAENQKKYASAVVDYIRSHMTKVSDVMQEGVDADGGYLVPEEWDAKIAKKLEEKNVIRSLASKIKTEGTHNIPICTQDPSAAWMDEGEPLTFSGSRYSNITIDAYKLGSGVKITEELLADNAYNIEADIIEAIATAIAKKEEDAFINGDGNKKPTGFLDATNGATIHTPIETFGADDVIDLVYSLKAPYRKNACFACNDDTLRLMRKFKDQNKQYLWQPSMQAGEPDRIMGYPIYTSPFFPKCEEGKCFLAFGDFSYYLIGDRGNRTFKRLDEAFAVNGMVGFMTKQRVDAKVKIKEAIQVLKLAEAEPPTP